MTTTYEKPELSLSEVEGTLLQGRLTSVGIEHVFGIIDLTLTLAEQGGYAAIGNEHAKAVRGVVDLALRDEVRYLDGLVKSTRIAEMLQRLDSPFGVNGLRGILAKVDEVESDQEARLAA